MNRLYGSDELDYIDRELLKRYRLGDVFAFHPFCSHRYRVKKGGRKEHQILESVSKLLDDDTCSVCFKLRCQVDSLPSNIEYVMRKDGIDKPNFDLLQSKHKFYQWLYERLN